MLLAAEEGDKFEAYQGYDCNELRAMSTSLYLHKVTNYYSGFRFLILASCACQLANFLRFEGSREAQTSRAFISLHEKRPSFLGCLARRLVLLYE